MKKSIILLSHSRKITDGLKEMIDDMQQNEDVEVVSLGGTSDGGLGSEPLLVVDHINQSAEDVEFFIFSDIGSAVLSADMAMDFLDESQQLRYHNIDAPLVEGAFVGAITAGVTDDTNQIIDEARKAK